MSQTATPASTAHWGSLVHGGTDDGPAIVHDFSTNAWPGEPPPMLEHAVRAAQRRRYPDPSYRLLRERLAKALGDEPDRILPSSGGSEAIRRLSLMAALSGLRRVWVPRPGFGEYAAAAQALGLSVQLYRGVDELSAALLAGGRQQAALVWICEPCNPTGESVPAALWPLLERAVDDSGSQLAVDLAYEPLRLEGASTLPNSLASRSWRLHCPNKALGLTGVRAAFLQAPLEAEAWVARLLSLAPSWVLSAEGEALLMHWLSASTQTRLVQARSQLRQWREGQRAQLDALGWRLRPTDTNFWLCQPDKLTDVPRLLVALRQRSIKLRDAASLGAPGWLRLSAQPPESQLALMNALEAFV